MDRLAWYRRIAPGYDLICRPLYAGARADAVRALQLQPGQRVLDLGCGTGLALPALAEAVGPTGEVVGVDGSPQMLARARRRTRALPQVRLLQQELGGFARDGRLREESPDAAAPDPLPDPGFDALLLGMVLAVVDDWQDVFARAWQQLRPGGQCVVYDTRPLPRGLRWWNPLFVPVVGWTGAAQLRRPTWQVLDGRAEAPSTRDRMGGFVHLTVGRKPGDALSSAVPAPGA